MLGNSFIASGSSDYTGDGWPDKQLGRRDLFSFVPILLISIFTLSICILTIFLVLFQPYTVSMHKCTGEHSHLSSAFPIGILNILAFLARRNTPYVLLPKCCLSKTKR